MKALVLSKPDTFPQLEDFQIQEPKAGEVQIEVSASALNRRDYWICKGMYPGIKFPVILGSDVCGSYKGKEVIVNPGFEWGMNENVQADEFHILGLPSNGSFAERVNVPESHVYPKPPHLSEVEAAALPLGGVTAFRALFSRANLKPTDKVLISGVGGGVASLGLQFALAHGCEVWVTSGSPSKISKAIDLGAAGGVCYKADDWNKDLKKKSGGFDVILDSAAGEGFSSLVKLLNPAGRIVFYGGTRGKITQLNPQFIFWRQISILGSTMGSPRDFEQMLQFVNHHKIKPVVEETYSLDQVEAAFKSLERNDQFGKLVLKP